MQKKGIIFLESVKRRRKGHIFMRKVRMDPPNVKFLKTKEQKERIQLNHILVYYPMSRQFISVQKSLYLSIFYQYVKVLDAP